MKLAEYSRKDVPLGAAQFAIAIALDLLKETTASNAVLCFLSGEEKYNTSARVLPGVTTDISVLTARQQLQKFIRSNYNEGMVRGLLRYLNSYDVLVDVSTGTYSKISFKSLETLLNVNDIFSVYCKTIEILFNNEVNDLICVYMRTNRFYKEFSKMMLKVYRKSADGLRANNLSSGVIHSVLDDFYNFVKNYSSDGVYQTDTCTPDKFLFHTFNAFYSRHPKNNLFKILNSFGQDMVIADKSTTALSLVGLENKQPMNDIDFIAICTAINKASQLLFTHNKDNKSFDDIFSYHRRLKLKPLINELNLLFKRVKGISLVTDSRDIDATSSGNTSSINAKWKGRKVICDIFEEALQKDFSADSLYYLYKDILNKTKTLGAKEGARLFKTEGSTTRHVESNSNMLEIIVNAYVALQKLLDFFDSNANSFGLNVFNFPIDIFRDTKYLSRFKSLDEYIELNKVVKNLMQSEDGSDREYHNGVRSNEEVHKILGACSLLDGNRIIQNLKGKPLSYFQTATKVVEKAENKPNIVKVVNTCRNRLHSYTKYYKQKGNILEDNKLLNQLGVLILKKIKEGDDIFRADNLLFVISFIDILKFMMDLEQNPVMSQNGLYLLHAENSEEEFKYINKCYAKLSEKYRLDIASLRIVVLGRLYEAITGEKLSTPVLDRNQLRLVFNVIDNVKAVEMYLNSYFDSIVEFGEDEKSLYLMLVCAARDTDLLELKLPVTESTFLHFMKNQLKTYGMGGVGVSELISMNEKNNHLSVTELIEINSEINAVTIRCINRFFDSIKLIFSGMSIIADYVADILPNDYSLTYVDPDVELLLIEASDSISFDTINDSAQQKLYNCEFDDYGYLLCHGSRYSLDGAFIHSSGSLVTPKVSYGGYDLKPLDRDTLNRIKIDFMTKG